MERKVDMDRVLKQFERLAKIDSLSKCERQMADALTEELAMLGFEVTEDDAGSYYGSDTGNLYGFLKGSDPSRKPVLFSAHMDTVAPGTGKKPVIDKEKGIITSEGDTVLGSDDVSGIVEILEGIRMAKEDPAGYGDIEVLFTASEETYCTGASHFDFSRVRSEEVFIPDLSGSIGLAAIAAPSIITFEFTVKGKPSHAGFDPKAGINAIAAASDIISQTDQGLLKEGLTLNIGTIEGGTATNIVSGSCRCEGEIRGNVHEEAMAVLLALKERAEIISNQIGASCDFTYKVNIKAYATPEFDPVCKCFIEACSRIGIEGKLITTQGGSDNNVFAEHGLRGIVTSSGMSNTHSVDEYIRICDLEMGSKLIAEIISLR